MNTFILTLASPGLSCAWWLLTRLLRGSLLFASRLAWRVGSEAKQRRLSVSPEPKVLHPVSWWSQVEGASARQQTVHSMFGVYRPESQHWKVMFYSMFALSAREMCNCCDIIHLISWQPTEGQHPPIAHELTCNRHHGSAAFFLFIKYTSCNFSAF